MKKKPSNYACGFAFRGEEVLLIKKKRPVQQEGKLNGIGGHIEKDESPGLAMIREFGEETGIYTQLGDWQLFAILDCSAYKQGNVYFFGGHFEELNFIQKTEEKVGLYNMHLHNLIVMPNLHWLIPMYLAGPKGAYMEFNWPFHIKEPKEFTESNKTPIIIQGAFNTLFTPTMKKQFMVAYRAGMSKKKKGKKNVRSSRK